jgi:hypothetical protein
MIRLCDFISSRHARTGVIEKMQSPARFSHGKSDPSDIAKIKSKTNVKPAAIMLTSFVNHYPCSKPSSSNNIITLSSNDISGGAVNFSSCVMGW